MNSASRLRAVLDDWRIIEPKRRMVEGWAQVLEFAGPAHEKIDVATEATRRLRDQLTAMHQALQELGAPDALTENAISTLRNSFNVTQLEQPWQGHKEAVLGQPVLLTLEWAGWALTRLHPNDDETFDEGILRQLTDRIVEHELLLDQTNIPRAIRTLLRRQVRELREALLMYKIAGSEPLQDAVKHSIGSLTSAGPEVAAEMETATPEVQTAVKRAFQLLGKAAELSDKLGKVAKFGADVYRLGSAHGPALLSYVKNLIDLS